ncbi:MAG: hypothetical protein AAGD86_10945 [Pseudomonadota bacterium]
MKQPKSYAVRAFACAILITTNASAGDPPAAAALPVPLPGPTYTDVWAYEQTFDGDPAAPSQALLPADMEFVATHRTHPQEQFTKAYAPYLADHGDNCAGPNPDVVPLPQHFVYTRQDSHGKAPDESFFVCKNHMMTALGEVDPYSNSAFWPKQEFDFSDGGTLMFDVNINLGFGQRVWWEVMITPRDQLKASAAPLQSAVDETYPLDRIVLQFREGVRAIRVGKDALAPHGWLVDERQFFQYDFAYWRDLHPFDPALDDRRIRRTMRVRLEPNRVIWGIETEEGTFDEYTVDVPEGLPFDRGLVVFKTHAYTPVFHNNFDNYTFHWDNIRFDGPVVGRYESYPASDVVYLQRNGDRPLDDTQTVTIDLPRTGRTPVLFGQVNAMLPGQALVSINGGPELAIEPYQFADGQCASGEWRDWTSFRMELDPAWLRPGVNTLRWRVGPRPACAEGTGWWNGYSVKFLQVQLDERR